MSPRPSRRPPAGKARRRPPACCRCRCSTRSTSPHARRPASARGPTRQRQAATTRSCAPGPSRRWSGASSCSGISRWRSGSRRAGSRIRTPAVAGRRGTRPRLDYVNRGRASDVKVAWELSRHAPPRRAGPGRGRVGDDEPTAAVGPTSTTGSPPTRWAGRSTGRGRWRSALRAVNLICVDGILLAAGRDDLDREALVRSLYQHGWFLARNLEISDVNGNHYLADAVGLRLARAATSRGSARRRAGRAQGLEMPARRPRPGPPGRDRPRGLAAVPRRWCSRCS